MFRNWPNVFLMLLAMALSLAAEITPNGYVIKRWDLDDGLPLITVKDILQGSDGQLWLGTWDTISRFDGLHFETYSLVNQPEIISGNTEVIMEDPNGDVWIGTSHSLLRWRKGSFTVFGAKDGLNNAFVKTLQRDADGVLWVGTDEGLHRETETGRFELVSLRKEGLEPRIDAMASDGETLWIGSWEGVFRKRPGKEIERVTPAMRVNLLSLDGHGRPVIKVLPQSLMRLEEDGSLTDFGKLNASAFTKLRNGELWAGTRDSRVVRLPEDLSQEPELILQMSGAELHSIYEDRQGNVWLGASATGLTCLMPRPFDLLSETLGLPFDHLGCFYRRKNGDLFLGTFGKGAYQLQGQEWEFLPYGKEVYKIPPYNGNISAINETLDGKDLWLATHGGALGIFRNGQLEYAGSVNRCRALCPDAESGMWIGSNNMGIFLVRDGKDAAHYHAEHGLSNNDVHAMVLDREGNLWISTQRGLNRLRDGKFTSYFREDGLGINAMRYLHVGRDGTLWVATGGAGLVRHRGGVFDRITVDHGLPSNFPTCILEDDGGRLWIGTTNGLCVAPLEEIHRCFDGSSSHIPFHSFGKSDGITMPTIGSGFQPTGIQADDGKVWFVAGGDVLVFDPETIDQAEPSPNVSIRGVRVDGQALPLEEEISIPSNSDRLTFQYGGTHLTNPEQLTFRYLLEYYDHEWVSAGSDREVAYSHLPPGHYRFQVASGDGRDSSIASQWIRVLPDWWQTWWFRDLLVLTALALLIGAYLWRRASWKHVRIVQERFATQLIKGQEEERKRIAAELHDGLGQSLLVAKNQLTLVRQEAAKGADVHQSLQEVSATMTATVDEVRAIAHALRPYELDRLGFTHAVNAMLERLRHGSTLQVESVVTPIDGKLSSASELSLYRVMQEALNNIVKHAEASTVRVQLTDEGKAVRLMIEDNGQGFDPNDPTAQQGMGLTTMAERIRLLGGKLEITSGSRGATLRAELPLITQVQIGG